LSFTHAWLLAFALTLSHALLALALARRLAQCCLSGRVGRLACDLFGGDFRRVWNKSGAQSWRALSLSHALPLSHSFAFAHAFTLAFTLRLGLAFAHGLSGGGWLSFATWHGGADRRFAFA